MTAGFDVIVSDILSLVFGNISIVMSIAIEFPQLVSIFKTKNTSGTSLTTYILFLFASVLWVTWALLNYAADILSIPEGCNLALHIAALIPAILGNFMNLFFVGSILYFKIRNICICKKLNISELQYSKIIFDKQKKYSWFKKYWPLFIFALVGIVIMLLVILITYLIGIPKSDQTLAEKLQYATLAFNIAAAIFFESVSWPQFIKSMKTKDTSGISLGWAIFLPLSCLICWSYNLCLAFSNGVLTVLASLICSGIFINTAVLVLKIINIRKAKKLGISEWVYTNRYISKNKSR